MTLIELIVSFMLLSVFITVASMIMSSAANIYYQVKSISYGMQVSEILQEKIAEELEGALSEKLHNKEYSVLIQPDEVEFTNSSKNHVSLRLTEENEEGKQYLELYYHESEFIDEINEPQTIQEEYSWTFDKAMYMGYSVKELSFSKPEGNFAENVIEVELTITSPKYGDYTTTKYLECYNFDDSSSALIKDGDEL